MHRFVVRGIRHGLLYEVPADLQPVLPGVGRVDRDQFGGGEDPGEEGAAMNIIIGIAGALFALLLGLLGIERKKGSKERSAKEEAESERDRLRIQFSLEQEAGRIKDKLRLKQKGNEAELEEVVQAVQDIEDKEVPDEQKRKEKANLVNDLTDSFNNRTRRLRDGK